MVSKKIVKKEVSDLRFKSDFSNIASNSHGIRNPNTRHWVSGKGNDRRYICLSVVGITPSKVAKSMKDVTCQNCYRILKKSGKLK